jgi:hypothetical protein
MRELLDASFYTGMPYEKPLFMKQLPTRSLYGNLYVEKGLKSLFRK